MAYKYTSFYDYVDNDGVEHGGLYAFDDKEADELADKEKLKYCKLVKREVKSPAQVMREGRERNRAKGLVPFNDWVDERDKPEAKKEFAKLKIELADKRLNAKRGILK